MLKQSLADLAIFGGAREFEDPKPISNLPRPSFETFCEYLEIAYANGQLTGGGELVARLERRLAEFHDVEHCVAFSSGFWALAAVMKTLSREGRSEIVMPSLTYRRMADIAGWAGLKPRFCEVDPATMTNTATCVLPCLNDDTAMIVGVHPINGLADIGGLVELASARGLPLVFDSVESVYECFHGERIGRFGRAEVFSLGASKLLNGFEGGYVTTRSDEVAESLRQTLLTPTTSLAEGSVKFNAILSEVHAAMALACLDDIDSQVIRNKGRYFAYKSGLRGLRGVRLLEFDESDRPGYKNIIVEVMPEWPLSRDDTIAVLNAEMILARAYYPQPLHARKMGFPHIPCSLPTTERLATRFALLPCGELVTPADISRICDLLQFLSKNGEAAKDRLAKRQTT